MKHKIIVRSEFETCLEIKQNLLSLKITDFIKFSFELT